MTQEPPGRLAVLLVQLAKKADALEERLKSPRSSVSNRQIVFAVMVLFIFGFYKALPHDTDEDKALALSFSVFIVALFVLLARAVLWLAEQVLKQPRARKRLKDALDEEGDDLAPGPPQDTPPKGPEWYCI
ncbi:MAG: hypothetical protein EPN97_00625 [Alphaproteobacteria bacterium]|nr:MAG: hypothetical protein EPN97_00625 [Alphaproteobacteria bacterium]